jgi:Mrp family chromosome partitioning ATPase
VVLVDMDLRKPSINRHLGISWRYGVGDFLRGSVPLQKVAVNPGIDRLAVVLGERPCQNSSEMISSPRTAELVEQVKQGEGRIAVFDMPPILASDDMLAFSPLVDAVLIVVAQGKTKLADLPAARELLQNMNVIGVVLNQCSDEVAPYYYYGTR